MTPSTTRAFSAAPSFASDKAKELASLFVVELNAFADRLGALDVCNVPQADVA
jgi:hypothetical protein